MGPPRVSDLRVGDVVRLKKAHPCGGFLWLVNRVGGDIGLRCQTCEHHIMIPRFRIDRRIREIVRRRRRVGGLRDPVRSGIRETLTGIAIVACFGAYAWWWR